MKKFLNSKTAPELFFIFILSLTPLLWFKSNSIMVGHDNVFPLNPPLFLKGRLFTWIEHGFGQSQALIMGTIPIHLIDALPSMLGFPLQLTQKIVYIFWFFSIGASAYILASDIFPKNRWSRLTAVVLYQFNFFVLQAWFIGERTKFSAYIAFPLILVILFRVFENRLKPVKGALIVNLILFLFNGGGLYGISLYGGVFLSLFVFLIYYFISAAKRKQYDGIKNAARLIFLTVAGYFVFSSYYLLPASIKLSGNYFSGVRKVGGVAGITDWAGEISANASYANVLRLQGISEWYDNPEHPYAKYYLQNPFLISVSFLFPAMIILSLRFTRFARSSEQQRKLLFFLSLFLLGVLFTAGTHPPLGFIYKLYIRYIPGFIAFRSPYFKFAPSIFLGFALIAAFSLENFRLKFQKTVFVVFFSLTIIYHFPYFTGSFFDWRKGFTTRNTIPSYVFDFGNWIENEKEDDGRILLLPPTNSDWQYDIYNWGYLSLHSFPSLLTNKSLVLNDNKLNRNEEAMVKMLYGAVENKDKNLFLSLSSALRIRYVLLRNDFNFEVKWAKTAAPVVYREYLEKQFHLVKVKQFGKWDVYEVSKDINPKFFLTGRATYASSGIENLPQVYNAPGKLPDFIFNHDKEINEEIIPEKMIIRYLIPDCVNCGHEIKPFVEIKSRAILPDSFLYPIVQFSEMKKKNGSYKNQIYDDLGLSLKRVAEIKEVLIVKNILIDEVINNYVNLLRDITAKFALLEKYSEKLETAYDIETYLNAESKYLRFYFGSYIVHGSDVDKVTRMYNEIGNVISAVAPYIPALDRITNRQYEFFAPNQRVYEILIDRDSLLSGLDESKKLILNFDNSRLAEKDFTTEATPSGRWLSFEKREFTAGMHNLVLSLPPAKNFADSFQKDDHRLFEVSKLQCYSSNIKNFSNKNVYRVSFDFLQNFSENMQIYFMYTREKEFQRERKIEKMFKFSRSIEEQEYQDLIFSTPDVVAVQIGLCTPKLTKEVIDLFVRYKAEEIIHPFIIMVPDNKERGEMNEMIDFRRINPTKYSLKFNISSPRFLVFSERYDESWKLSGFNDNHFIIDGYANGWVLDKPGSYELTLEYQTQKYFYAGCFISFLSVIGAAIYLAKSKQVLN